MNFQRDAFIAVVNQSAQLNKDIVFLSADFGAPALDDLRKMVPDQFFHLGISEQNLIDVAIGLALKGKVVFTYAMAPFISLRCAEQHKVAAMMKLPIINLIAGVGLGYANAGPTHYATEDYGLAVSTIGSSVITVADAPAAAACAKSLIVNPRFCFVRMDRAPSKDLCYMSDVEFEKGYRTFHNGDQVAVVSHGYMLGKLHQLLAENKELTERVKLFDLFFSKPLPEGFARELSSFKSVIVVDEQIEHSSLGRYLLREITANRALENVITVNLKEAFMFANSGRDGLIEEAGLGDNELCRLMSEIGA